MASEHKTSMRFFNYILFCLSILVTSTTIAQQKKVTVVIDAGHGGSDPGHLPTNTKLAPEKDVNLIISNFVGEYIKKYLSNVEVIYTRTDDSFISLGQRVEIANQKKVDYFISIHCNANDRAVVHGTETHVHNINSVKSVKFAAILEQEFANRAGRKSRGIKDTQDREHSLQVLKYTQMTSVLIECGFLTNDREANYLNTLQGQEILASAIFRGFRTFITKEHPTINFLTPPTAQGEYAIQIMSSKEPIDTQGKAFKHVEYEVIRQELITTNAYKYRYIVGSFSTKEEGNTILEYLKTHGFKDAITISTKN